MVSGRNHVPPGGTGGFIAHAGFLSRVLHRPGQFDPPASLHKQICIVIVPTQAEEVVAEAAAALRASRKIPEPSGAKGKKGKSWWGTSPTPAWLSKASEIDISWLGFGLYKVSVWSYCIRVIA